MKKIALAGLAGMLLVSASVNAMSISGQAGKEYTNIGVGFGTESTGLALSGNWTHNDDDGDVAGVGLGLNLPIGPLMATVGGKGVYTNPNYGDEGYAAAVGGGLQMENWQQLPFVGEYYYSPGFALQRYSKLLGSECWRALHHYASSQYWRVIAT